MSVESMNPFGGGMKALLYSAVGKLDLVDLPVPEPEPGEVRVRVRATGICGSDIHGFLGHQKRRQPGLVLGHESTGVIDAYGEGVPRRLVGQRVAINPLLTCRGCAACRSGRQNNCPTWTLLGMDRMQGAFAEYVIVPECNTTPIPDSVSDEEAVMIEPLANAISLISKIPIEAGLLPEVVIWGGGTLGACILSVARLRGCRVVCVVEPNPRRGAVASKLGAEKVVAPDDVGGLPRVPVAIDAVGRASTREAAAGLVQSGGTVLLLGLDEGATTLDFQDLVRREVRLQASYGYNDSHFMQAVALVSERRVDFRSWTDLEPMENGQASFDRLVKDPGDRLKIALRP